MPEAADLTRLRAEYAARERRLAGRDLYSAFNLANLFIIQQRQRAIMHVLRRHCPAGLSDQRVLEVGCGRGDVLLEFLTYGAPPRQLYGTDFLFDRVCAAHQLVPQVTFTNADAQNLPYASAAFDLLLQFTVFSSILDESIKINLACEMLRVLRPGGLILWYDFWLNPTNPQTHGIRPTEIRQLFPNCRFDFRRITLAPPLARALVPLSWTLALILEKLTIFNSHYLVAIHPLTP